MEWASDLDQVDLTKICEEHVRRVADRLNYPPGKVLGYRSPYEVFLATGARYAKSPSAVALEGEKVFLHHRRPPQDRAPSPISAATTQHINIINDPWVPG